MDAFRLIYADLSLRQRAMIEVLGRHGIVVPERFEAEVNEWISAHGQTEGAEAIDRLRVMLANLDRLIQECEES